MKFRDLSNSLIYLDSPTIDFLEWISDIEFD